VLDSAPRVHRPRRPVDASAAPPFPVIAAEGRTLDSIKLRRNYSRNILLRMIVLGAIVAAVIVYNGEFLANLYLKRQETPVAC